MDARMHRLTLRFADACLEQAFAGEHERSERLLLNILFELPLHNG